MGWKLFRGCTNTFKMSMAAQQVTAGAAGRTSKGLPHLTSGTCVERSLYKLQLWRDKQMQFLCPALNIWDMLEPPPGYLSGGHHPMLQQVHQEQRKSFGLVCVRAQCLLHFQWDTTFIQTLFYQLLFVNIAKGCPCLSPADRAAHGSLNFTHHSAGICPLQVTLLTGLGLDIYFNTFGLEFWFRFK